MPAPIQLSIVVPAYNEADNILPLAREVAAAFPAGAVDYELVFVDDGSTDATWEQIRAAHRADPRVHGLRLARNCGQSAALWAGIQTTTRPVIATLDSDLQNDPADLPLLLAELGAADFVCGARVQRQDSLVRRLSSRIARWARHAVLGTDFLDTGCALRVFRRETVQGLFSFNGLHRFLPVLVHGGGFKTKEIPVNHRPRVAGVSKYGVWNRLGRGVADLFAIAWFQKRRNRPVSFTRWPESPE